MKKKPSVLIVSRKVFKYFWIEVDRYYYLPGDDIMDILRKYRDIYKNKYGSDKIKITHQWFDDIYDKW